MAILKDTVATNLLMIFMRVNGLLGPTKALVPCSIRMVAAIPADSLKERRTGWAKKKTPTVLSEEEFGTKGSSQKTNNSSKYV